MLASLADATAMSARGLTRWAILALTSAALALLRTQRRPSSAGPGRSARRLRRPRPQPGQPVQPSQPARPRPAPPKPAAPKPGEAAKQVEQPEPPPPPYEPQLLRLSEIMGALAFLRPLCGSKDEDEWRGRMTRLIDAEASTQPRKERLAGAYNRGYREYAQTYRVCTPSAQLIITRFLDEGGKLARELSSRYGG